MSQTLRPRMDVLPEAQLNLWPALRPSAKLGFVLYGGTAVALRLGHRQSVDFDFFSDQPLKRAELHAAFPFIRTSVALQDQQNTLTVNVPTAANQHHYVKVSFFGNIGFGRVGTPNTTDDAVVQVASLDDLMATKVKVILQRAEAKDYRDIAAMVRVGTCLDRALAAARVLFGTNFQPSESLKALVYYEDGDLKTLSEPDRVCLIEAASAVRALPTVAVESTRLSA
jgi:Nucleotidyl transferase AbiEii toxin, Type IV TA system